jgi:hypothetical protein
LQGRQPRKVILMQLRLRPLSRAALILYFTWCVALSFGLHSVVPALFLAALFTGLTLAIFVMVWGDIGARVRSATSRVPNPFRTPDQVMADVAARLRPSARTSYRDGKPSVSRKLEVAINGLDYNSLLDASTLADLETYLTKTYVDQLRREGIEDLSPLPLVTLVATHQFGRGRFTIADIDTPRRFFRGDVQASESDQPTPRRFSRPARTGTRRNVATKILVPEWGPGATGGHGNPPDGGATADSRAQWDGHDATAVMQRPARAGMTLTAKCGAAVASTSGPAIIVGSGAGCGLRVQAPGVRSEHLSIYQIGGSWVVRAFDGSVFYVAGNPRTAVDPVDGLALHLTGNDDSPVVYLGVTLDPVT